MASPYQFISTPSHGYLMVPEVKYRASGYKASRFSYRGNGYVYLEEDCDATGFMKAAGVTSDHFADVHVERDITLKLTPMSGAGFVSPYADAAWRIAEREGHPPAWLANNRNA